MLENQIISRSLIMCNHQCRLESNQMRQGAVKQVTCIHFTQSKKGYKSFVKALREIGCQVCVKKNQAKFKFLKNN